MEITDIKLPEGFEAKFEGKTLVVTKADENLDTWEKCVKYVKEVEYQDVNCYTENVIIGEDYTEEATDHNLVPKGYSKKFLALMQLIICRNAWWKKYDCGINENTSIIYSITHNKRGSIVLDWNGDCTYTLNFNNKEVRDKFASTFKDLIEQAKDLL